MVTLSFGKTTFFRLYDISLPSTSLDGFEPSTFRLTAERANRLRHRDSSRATCRHRSISILKSLSESKRLDHAENITDYWSCSVNRLIFFKFYFRLQSHEDKISIILSRIFFFLKMFLNYCGCKRANGAASGRWIFYIWYISNWTLVQPY